jgi:hypothetical protein
MKNIYYGIIILILGIGFVWYTYYHREMKSTPVVVEQPQTFRKCFASHHEATKDAPYTTSEYIDLMVNGTSVSGIKKGTQEGPDMTNGYEGTLVGTKQENALHLLFAYIIEGSKNKEQEEYVMSDTKLIKYRYPLLEKQSMLVPDMSKEPTQIEYIETDCK